MIRSFLTVIAVATAFVAGARAEVQLGIDVLQSHDFSLLAGKRVGLISNQTSVNSEGVRTRVLLRKHCNLVALFTPEHGLDGTEGAGRYVSSRRDPLTGLIAHSLYGPTRKPTPAMLAGIDTLVFDLQDIGCRSYTYISTMGRCMEAAGENHIGFVVLDRPNPLGGTRVEGPSVEQRWISFVGQFPVPYVHGMTAGELARMANAEGWTAAKCDLTVVSMHGWERDMTWGETGLRWVPSSPNIPRGSSPLYYVATGLVGELSGPELGIGGPAPFESIAAGWLNAESFTEYLRSLDLAGISVRPFRSGRYQGSALKIEPNARANLTGFNVYCMAEMNRLARSHLFAHSSASKLDIFFKVYGSASIRAEIEGGRAPATIIDSWASNVQRFRRDRTPFLLY